MPFDRPTLSELITRVQGDLSGRLAIFGAIVRRAMANVLATVWAGAVHMLHGHLEYLSRQLFADTSDREYLLRQAAMYGITTTPATFAVWTGFASGVDGTLIPIGTIVVRSDGTRYRLGIDSVVSSGSALLVMQALVAGSDANAALDDIMVFESPIAGVDSSVTLALVFDGSDEEPTDELRDRLLLNWQAPPQGGVETDYEAWALAVSGVTRAWVYPNEDGLGTVTVRFVRDNDVSIFPSVGEVADVQAALDEQRPITAEVTAEAPTALTVNFTIELTPDTTAVRDAVEAELLDLLVREAEPGDGSGGGTIKLSKIRTAIGVATGVEDYVLTVPASDVVPALGQLPVLGTVTWV